MEEIKPDEVVKLVENDPESAIIEVLEDVEVAEGKISKAQHIPLGQIADRMDGISQGKNISSCGGSGGRSGRVCELLKVHAAKSETLMAG